MLEKKFKHKKIKPRPKKESEFLSWLHAQSLTCFSCGKQNKIELHHIKTSSSDQKDDRFVLPLCGEECHRNGAELSPHGTPKKWRSTYPIEVQLRYSTELYLRYKKEMIK